MDFRRLVAHLSDDPGDNATARPQHHGRSSTMRIFGTDPALPTRREDFTFPINGPSTAAMSDWPITLLLYATPIEDALHRFSTSG